MKERPRCPRPNLHPETPDGGGHRYLLAGARGGQGTTTIATVLAVMAAGHGPVRLLATRPDDVCALAGCATPATWTTPALVCPRLTLGGVGTAQVDTAVGREEDHQPSGDASEVTVVDLGRLVDLTLSDAQADTDDDGPTTRWLVVRGPCYLSLRAALAHPWQPDGVILLAEAGRALTASDVTDVLGAPVVAQVPIEAAVARVVDAGLLLGRLHRQSAFRSLARLDLAHRSPDALRSAS